LQAAWPPENRAGRRAAGAAGPGGGGAAGEPRLAGGVFRRPIRPRRRATRHGLGIQRPECRAAGRGRGGAAAAQDLAAARHPAGALRGHHLGNGGSDLLGSPLDLLGDTAAFGEQDALATRYQAARDAWNYRIQAANQTSQADFYANSAVAPLRNYDPGLGIAKSLLGGTSDFLGIAVKRGVLE